MTGKFTFILLDVLSVIKGWHDKSQSGITSNEVRDTTMEPFVVKAFKGGQLAVGLYQQIRDRVNALGANFHSNLYIAFRLGEKLEIGSLILKGSALGSWMEFSKKNRKDLYAKAIQITGFTDGKKGSVKFRTPNFAIADVSPESDQAAKDLDKQLQEYLNKYLSRPKTEQADRQQDFGPGPEPDPEPQPDEPPPGWGESSAEPEPVEEPEPGKDPEDVPF